MLCGYLIARRQLVSEPPRITLPLGFKALAPPEARACPLSAGSGPSAYAALGGFWSELWPFRREGLFPMRLGGRPPRTWGPTCCPLLALSPVLSGSRDPACFLATGGLGVPRLSPQAGTEDKVRMAWSGRLAALGGRTRAGEGRVCGKAAPRRMLWGSSFEVPVQAPSPQGAFTALTEHVWFVAFNVCGLAMLWPVGTSSRQVGRAERSGGWPQCSWAVGGLPEHTVWSAVLQPGLDAQVVGSGQWAVASALCLNTSWPCGAAGRSLRRAGPHRPASRDAGGSLALKSL